MQEDTKGYLPSEWWSIAEVVDAYESQSDQESSDLRPYAQRVAADHQLAALAELVKVDFELRWNAGEPRRIEQYFEEYPELRNSSVSLTELIRHQCLVRSRCHDKPSLEELRSRFPDFAEQRLLGIRESAAAEYVCVSSAEPPADQGDGGRPALPDVSPPPSEAVGDPTIATGDPWRTIAPPLESPKTTTDRDTRRRGRSKTRRSNGFAAQSARPESEERQLTTIGRNRVGQKLGSGGFGLVYRCRDDDLKRDVAIKVPHKHLMNSEQQRQGLLHEAQSAARLRHPGIVTVLAADQTDDGLVYIVYEFIDGMTLRDRLKTDGFTYQQAAVWVAQTADALHHAHIKGIVHRDVKPSNILLDKEGRPHVTDFGLAKIDDHYFRDDTGAVVGSFAYMSPEQASGQSQWATPQSDIYSLGATLYELLCKKRPFKKKDDVTEALEEIKRRPPTPPRTIDDRIPKGLEQVCLKAMRKDPADRYTTAADMAAELRAAVAPRAPANLGRRFLIGAAGAAAIVLAFMLIDRRSPVPPTILLPTPIPIVDGALDFDIHYQAARESYIFHKLSEEKITLHDDDKVQLHANLQGRPRYLYLYWYNAKGTPRRLWPQSENDETLTQQKKVTKVNLPTEKNEDQWYLITPDRGAEIALVAYRDKPLDAKEIKKFETQMPYRNNGQVDLDEVVPITTEEVKAELRLHGLGGLVESPSNPVTQEFRSILEETFDGFYGLVIPHKPKPGGDAR